MGGAVCRSNLQRLVMARPTTERHKMTLKKSERKELYIEIEMLMLRGENKAAFEKLTSMAADDVRVYCLADYDKTMERLKEMEGAH